MKKRTRVFLLVACATCVCALAYGTGAVLGSADLLRSFSADMTRAFSATFLRQEEFLGEIDFKSDDTRTETIVSPECAFDTLSLPLRKRVILNEIAWMGSGGDYRDEWIEIRNISDAPMDVSFWKIKDRNDISFEFPRGEIIPSGAVRVIKREGGFGGSLKNSGEHVRLFNALCELEDEAGGAQWEAGDNMTKQTMERDLSGFGWHTSASPGGTPGDENSNFQTPVPISRQAIFKNTEDKKKDSEQGSVKRAETSESEIPKSAISDDIETKNVRIVEVVAGIEGNTGYEFIRLKNISDSAISLTGWTVKKRSSTGNETTLVSESRLEGKIISVNGEFLLAREGGYSGIPEPDVWWPKSYTLAQSNNAVIFYDANGAIMGEFSW